MKTPKQILAKLKKGCKEPESDYDGTFCGDGKGNFCDSCKSKISASKERWKEELEFLKEHEKEEYRGCSFTLKIRKRIAELKEVLE